MRSSQRLREAIHSTINQTDNDLEAQRQATEFALRKRIHEMERAKDEDEWQKQNVSLQLGSIWIETQACPKHCNDQSSRPFFTKS